MSRIGRLPVAIPAGVTVDIQENNHVVVKGPKGTLERTLPSEMTIKLERRTRSSYKTERSEENESSSWSDQNSDPQHGNWC